MADKVNPQVLSTLVRDWKLDQKEGWRMINEAEAMRRAGQKRLADADALLVTIRRYDPSFNHEAEIDAQDAPEESVVREDPATYRSGVQMENDTSRTYADMALTLIKSMEEPTMAEMTRQLAKLGWSKGWGRLDFNRFSSAAHGLAEPKTLVKQKVEKYKDPKTNKYRFKYLPE